MGAEVDVGIGVIGLSVNGAIVGSCICAEEKDCAQRKPMGMST